jgi:hypothetical protein
MLTTKLYGPVPVTYNNYIIIIIIIIIIYDV